MTTEINETEKNGYETMTVTRALSERKMLKKRIEKASTDVCPIGLLRGNGDKPIDKLFDTKASLELHIKSNVKSITDLIDRYRKINSAILKSNAITEIVIDKRKMTVAEAIELKSSIQFEKDLLRNSRYKVESALTQIKNTEHEIESKLDLQSNSSISKEKSTTGKEDLETLKNFLMDTYELKKCDPLGIEKWLNSLSEHIDNFENEIDFVLSESNARTDIVIN